MTEKFSVRKMSTDMESLKSRIKELEQRLETKFGYAVSKLRGYSGNSQTDAGQKMDELVLNVISNEYRQDLIEKTAYFRAEERGFVGGSPEQDWLEAEAEVDHYIMEQHTPEIEGAGFDDDLSVAAGTQVADSYEDGLIIQADPANSTFRPKRGIDD